MRVSIDLLLRVLVYVFSYYFIKVSIADGLPKFICFLFVLFI